YVVFDTKSFVDLPELPPSLGATYRQSGERLFATYLDLTTKVLDALRRRTPKPEGKPEAPYAAAIRAQALDLLRRLLPAGTRTNRGLTVNARAMEMLPSKMLSNKLAEVGRIAEGMLRASLHVAPTLVKYTAKNPYRASLRDDVAAAMPVAPPVVRVDGAPP